MNVQKMGPLIDALVIITTSLGLRLDRQETRAPRTGSGPTK